MKKKSILIIMKKDEYFQLLSEHLRVNNFDVIITENGKDGFETARNNLPDIIMTTYNLNGLDGIDLCYMVKNNSKLFATPFIIISNYMNRQERINAYRYGVDAIISSSISNNFSKGTSSISRIFFLTIGEGVLSSEIILDK